MRSCTKASPGGLRRFRFGTISDFDILFALGIVKVADQLAKYAVVGVDHFDIAAILLAEEIGRFVIQVFNAVIDDQHNKIAM